MPVILAGYMAFLVVLTVSVLTAYFYRVSNNQLLSRIDDQLFAAAYLARNALPDGYHTSIEDAGSVSDAEFDRTVERHNRLCRQLSLQYIWSCMVAGTNVVFTTATSPSHDVFRGDHARFFEPHRDPVAFDRVFSTMVPDRSSFKNEWGHGRMVLVPFRDNRGRQYCFGASMSVDDVVRAQRALLVQVVMLGCAVVLAGIVGTVFLSRLVVRPITRLCAAAGHIAHGNLTEPVHVVGPREIGRLSEALNAMRAALAGHIEELTRREEDQRRLLRSLSAAVVIHTPDTHIVYSNPMASRILGLTEEQMQGRVAMDPAWSFVREDGSPMPLPEYPVNRVLATRQPVSDCVVGISRSDRAGRTWVLVNAFPEIEPGGKLRDVVVTFVDITAMRRLEKQLLQAQKMEAIGQLAGGIAHDFNNILQAIKGYAELATDDLDAGHPARRSIQQVTNASERAAKLVGQLLAFGRRQILEPAHLEVNEVITGLTGMLERIIGEHIRLAFIPGHHLSTVHADRTMLEQVVVNLCVNARDAMPKGGKLTIETENVGIDDEYCQQNLWAHPGRYVLITVTDTGCGMDAATMEHIFEPFFTTKGTGKGTGLGLSTVYGIIRQHEGMVRVYSELNKGTTFKVYLPAFERPADTVGSKIEGLPPGGTETILVAEDDESLRDLVCRTLEHAGYRVIAAADGAEALELFEKNEKAIQFLLLDVVMPEKGGREVFDGVRGKRPGIPALFASGYSENAIHTNFVLEKGMKLIRKPYNANELLRRVREMLDGASDDGVRAA